MRPYASASVSVSALARVRNARVRNVLVRNGLRFAKATMSVCECRLSSCAVHAHARLFSAASTPSSSSSSIPVHRDDSDSSSSDGDHKAPLTAARLDADIEKLESMLAARRRSLTATEHQRPMPTPDQLAQLDYFDPQVLSTIHRINITPGRATGITPSRTADTSILPPRVRVGATPAATTSTATSSPPTTTPSMLKTTRTLPKRQPAASDSATPSTPATQRGRLTQLQACRLFALHASDPHTYTATFLATRFELDAHVVESILQHCRATWMWMEEEHDAENRNSDDSPVHFSSSLGVRIGVGRFGDVPVLHQSNARPVGHQHVQHLITWFQQKQQQHQQNVGNKDRSSE